MKAKFLIGLMTIIVMTLILAGTAMADTQLVVEPTWTPPPPEPYPYQEPLVYVYEEVYPYPLPLIYIDEPVFPYPGPGQDGLGLIMKSEQWWAYP